MKRNENAGSSLIIPRKCERCGKPMETSTCSFFNTEMICEECSKAERKHPKFEETREAEYAAIKSGDYNFFGIGLPDDLRGGEKLTYSHTPKGKRKIRPGDFEAERDAEMWEDDREMWSFELAARGNVDEIFGTNVETEENDDWINIYALVTPDFLYVDEALTIILVKGDGSPDEEILYHMAEDERAIVTEVMLRHKINQLQQRLNGML